MFYTTNNGTSFVFHVCVFTLSIVQFCFLQSKRFTFTKFCYNYYNIFGPSHTTVTLEAEEETLLAFVHCCQHKYKRSIFRHLRFYNFIICLLSSICDNVFVCLMNLNLIEQVGWQNLYHVVPDVNSHIFRRANIKRRRHD